MEKVKIHTINLLNILIYREGFMDTSEKYIKMCEMAVEIQEIRHGFSSGYNGELWKSGRYVQCHTGKEYISNEAIWLPRQDQLQEMLKANDTRVENMLSCSLWVSRSHINKNDSLESVWLRYVMDELYYKKWDDKNKEWIS